MYLDTIEQGEERRECYYRYKEVVYSLGVDEYDEPLPGPGRMVLCLMEFPIHKRTPKGAWIYAQPWPMMQETLILVVNTWNKRYACPTQKEALESFRARKLRQLQLTERTAAKARRAIHLAEAGLNLVELRTFYTGHGEIPK